jgi:hypothetical protein
MSRLLLLLMLLLAIPLVASVKATSRLSELLDDKERLCRDTPTMLRAHTNPKELVKDLMRDYGMIRQRAELTVEKLIAVYNEKCKNVKSDV